MNLYQSDGEVTVVISGASGLVGSEVLKYFLAHKICEHVIAVVRKPMDISHPKLTQKVIDFEELPKALEGMKADYAYCCLGTTLKAAGSKERQYRIDHDYVVEFARACRQAGVNSFSVVSSVGANPDSSNFYLRTKGEMERDLRQIHFRSLLILRPSLLMGKRKEFRFLEKISIGFMTLFNPFMLCGLKKYRGIKPERVAYNLIMLTLGNLPGIRILHGEDMW